MRDFLGVEVFELDRIPVVLDVDTGIDDALAIMLALRSPELEVLGITCVSGNVHVDKVVANTKAVVELMEEKIQVYKGAQKPLLRDLRTAEWVHGEDGLANTYLARDKGYKSDGNAIEALISLSREYSGDLVVVTTGPLTNLALALSVEPEVIDHIKEHYMMGGAFGVTEYGFGNASASAEFNIWQDPEAAKIVFQSELVTYAIGLDVTMDPSSALTLEDAEEIRKRGCVVCELAYRITKFYIENTGDPLMRLHDPMAVAAVVDKSLFEFVSLPVEVEVAGNVTVGTTITDKRPWARKKNRKNIACRVDGERFKRMFIERITKATRE